MSLITGYDGILDTGIHAPALLLIGQNLAGLGCRHLLETDMLLVCQVRLKHPI